MDASRFVSTAATLVGVAPVARDTRVYTVDLDAPMPFRAGQFVNLHVPGAHPHEERSYSVWSDPVDPRRLELVIRLVEGGEASTYLRGLAVGARVGLRGPFGVFTLGEGTSPVTFVATGTGVAPFRSMLEVAARQADPRRFRLYFGLRDEADVFAVDPLDRLVSALPDFRYELCLSRPSAAWAGVRGRVTDRLRAAVPLPEGEFFVCGNAAMVDEVRAWLREAGADRVVVHVEKY